MKNLNGKKAVVIGGSRGTGLAIVDALQLEGAEVLVVARNPESLAELASKWPNARTLQADMTDAATIETVFRGAPDLVILAGGAMPPSQPVVELDWETFSTNWNTDVKASYLLTQYALKTPATAGTLIVFISSGAAIGGSPISGGYAGAKRMQMFLANYAQLASNRLGLGLRFLTLVPWRLMKNTGTGDAVVPNYAAFLGVSENDFVAGMTQAQTKEDVADAVVAFANQWPTSDEGNVFVVSGNGVATESTMLKGAPFWTKR
ncbi:SDR family NAD(P)-dependent oxidoreductase [Spirosoma endbachense]|uniref:SDR family NAD(P)-dependent oxidoreductase n=1 Tax=Spirosoma endbachense TaxID=2666025 RepID=A0A6P1VVC2_9BACT|nr:SDR family oxidoreductase [Spirosoma endbachense]QHV96685.1 SDR family NAD(P)-dependent oxidoreductase [Spirosoma endbachense]